MEKMKPRERTPQFPTTAESTEIEVASSAIDAALVFHVVSDVLAFLLYMHQQIPSLLQDMTREFNSLQSEYKELDLILTQDELKASSRRKHFGRKRDIKMEIKRMEKLMTTISGIRNAFKLLISEVPNAEHIVFVFGASPRRPLCVYEVCFPHGGIHHPLASEDMTRNRTIELISRKIIRAFISKGVGSASYNGPSKLFLLVRAQTSFNMPLHFLPKRDFRYAKKVVPFRVQLRCRAHCQEMGTPSDASKASSFNSKADDSSDEIWFQCRHVIKGLAIGNPSPEE